MLTRVTGERLVLVRHAMPEVRPDVPAPRWHLGERGRLAARNLRHALPEDPYLVASDEPKAIETLAEASDGADVTIDAAFAEVRRPHSPSEDTHRALVMAYLRGAAHAGWEPHSAVVRRFDAALRRHRAEASSRGKVLVVGTHGTAMTVWLFASVRSGVDPVEFWAMLAFPDVIVVDPEAGKYQRSL